MTKDHSWVVPIGRDILGPGTMTEYLNQRFDWGRPEMVAVYDELPLWSSLAGSLLLEHVPFSPQVRLLDVGCGTGFPLLELAQRLGPSCRAFGIDPWQTAMARIRAKIDLLGIRNVELVPGDATAMPFKDGEFDLVVSNLGINNFDDPPKVLAECRRVTKPGGILALATNLRGQMQLFYEVFESTLRELGRDDWVDRLRKHVDHRTTLEGLSAMVEASGFSVRKTIRGGAVMRFTDGSALLRHAFVRLGFLDGWRGVVEAADQPAVFERLETNLNHMARERGELRLEIPLGYLEAA
jgi:arsenite methyltransferase